jgi:hypothetical protein
MLEWASEVHVVLFPDRISNETLTRLCIHGQSMAMTLHARANGIH